MTAFIAFIGWVVLSCSLRSLRDDPKLPRFVKYLSLALAGALVQALSPSLVQFAIAWVVVSIGLTRLLLHDRRRRGAQLAARSKFVVSRLGDLAMAVAIIILLAAYGSTDLAVLADAGPSTAMTIALCALVAAVVFKTAQLPFQHWLIGTFEVLNPRFCLMHAGVVNAGGFLVIRSAELFVHAPQVLDLLLVVGLVSAVGGLSRCGHRVIISAPSLVDGGTNGLYAHSAWLEVPGAAFLHLIGHGFYKANAFPRSGELPISLPPGSSPFSSHGHIFVVCGSRHCRLGVGVCLYPLGLTAGSATWDGLLLVQALAMGQLWHPYCGHYDRSWPGADGCHWCCDLCKLYLR